YSIDGGATVDVPMTYDGQDGNNPNNSHYTATTSVDIDALNNGTHEINVWFTVAEADGNTTTNEVEGGYTATFVTATIDSSVELAAGSLEILKMEGELQIVSTDQLQSVQIFTLNGAMVYNNANTTTVSTDALSTGVYIVKATTAKAMKVEKFVVK
ncbi:MAG: T9SS type A sorting domain-containing protein, partial [Prevotellaceae bacterium]|nr:T9SS type A sorting domain-containing protein [Prevotellaceae bacterium]